MQHVIDLLVSLIQSLFHLVVAAITAVESVLRSALAPMGIGANGQNVILLIVAVALIIGAIRLLGGVFALLISLVLLLIILHVLATALGVRA